MSDRFYLIRTQSRYETVECAYCGASITIDLDAGPETPPVSDPLDHEDDCHRAEDANPSEQATWFGNEPAGRPLIEVLADEDEHTAYPPDYRLS